MDVDVERLKAKGAEAVARLRRFVGTGVYILGAGGTNPTAESPVTRVGAGLGCDCIGAVLWAHKLPRHMTSFPEYEGDINCDSAIMDAEKGYQGGKGSQFLFRPIAVDDVYPGCLVVTPSIRRAEVASATRGTKAGTERVRIGHVEMVDSFPGDEWDGDFTKLTTVGCSGGSPAFKRHPAAYFGGNEKRTAYTVGDKTWKNPAWRTRILEVL